MPKKTVTTLPSGKNITSSYQKRSILLDTSWYLWTRLANIWSVTTFLTDEQFAPGLKANHDKTMSTQFKRFTKAKPRHSVVFKSWSVEVVCHELLEIEPHVITWHYLASDSLDRSGAQPTNKQKRQLKRLETKPLQSVVESTVKQKWRLHEGTSMKTLEEQLDWGC